MLPSDLAQAAAIPEGSWGSLASNVLLRSPDPHRLLPHETATGKIVTGPIPAVESPGGPSVFGVAARIVARIAVAGVRDASR